jgi:L-lactate dehydrogenase complex protein LldF
VYRRSGGYSYHNSIAGPIGSILMPNRSLSEIADLPFASSLCGSCSDVCPVKINIHEQLYKWRQEIDQEGFTPVFKKRLLKATGQILADPKKLKRMSKWASKAIKNLPRFLLYNSLNAWGKNRELPVPPQQTFSEWYHQNRKHE